MNDNFDKFKWIEITSFNQANEKIKKQHYRMGYISRDLRVLADRIDFIEKDTMQKFIKMNEKIKELIDRVEAALSEVYPKIMTDKSVVKEEEKKEEFPF